MDMDNTMTGMASPTTSGGMPTGTEAPSMDEMMGGCKISMLWNWTTVGACFISEDWKVTSKGIFALSVIGVFFLVILIEFTRRAAREFDRRILKTHKAGATGVPLLDTEKVVNPVSGSLIVKPTFGQQAIRATFYMLQFGAGYILMLLAMYYNGYILIFGIFFGAWAGFFLASWDTVGHGEPVSKDCCC